MYDRLTQRGAQEMYTDNYNVYQSVIRCGHVPGKAGTTHVESFWSDLRLFVKALNRKTKAYAKSVRTLCDRLKLYIWSYNKKLGY